VNGSIHRLINRHIHMKDKESLSFSALDTAHAWMTYMVFVCVGYPVVPTTFGNPNHIAILVPQIRDELFPCPSHKVTYL
jgi:hypothetical protein